MGLTTTTLQSQPNWLAVSLAAARRGDREAFEDLISPHAPRLQRLARRFTRSAEDAEDVCQESLLRAFTKLDQFDGTQTETHEFSAWLMRITRNCAIDLLRRKKAGRLVPLEECEAMPEAFGSGGTGEWREDPETRCRREEQLRMVATALAELPPELRRVCLLRNMMELSTKEAAARLGISAIAVRMRLFRAHGRLRKILNREQPHGRNRQLRDAIR